MSIYRANFDNQKPQNRWRDLFKTYCQTCGEEIEFDDNSPAPDQPFYWGNKKLSGNGRYHHWDCVYLGLYELNEKEDGHKRKNS